MRYIKQIITQLGELGRLSRLAIGLGAGASVLLLLLGLGAYIAAPYAANYFAAVALFRGCVEAGGATLVSGIFAGLLGDLMLRSRLAGK